MGLEAVDNEKQNIGEEDIESRRSKDGDEEREREAYLVEERVEE